jgi:hypothetical protein
LAISLVIVAHEQLGRVQLSKSQLKMKLDVLAVVGVQMLLNHSNSNSTQKVRFNLRTSLWWLLEWLQLLAAAIHHKWPRPGTKMLFKFF